MVVGRVGCRVGCPVDPLVDPILGNKEPAKAQPRKELWDGSLVGVAWLCLVETPARSLSAGSRTVRRLPPLHFPGAYNHAAVKKALLAIY